MSTFATFKRLKDKGLAALKQGDYVAAKPYLIQAGECIIEICLATRRYRDWAYVVEAIRARRLDRSFADELSPAARSAYFRCYDSRVEEDRYNPEIHDAPPDDEQSGKNRHD